MKGQTAASLTSISSRPFIYAEEVEDRMANRINELYQASPLLFFLYSLTHHVIADKRRSVLILHISINIIRASGFC